MDHVTTTQTTKHHENQVWNKIRYWVILNLGVFILTCGVYFFKSPNGFATGGVSGLSMLLAKVFPMVTQATYMAALNLLLLILGVLILGKEVGAKTVLCSLLFSGEEWLLERFLPLEGPLTDQPLLELVYAIMLTGIGSAIIFNCNASSGGTDIAALILKKYTSLNVGRALLLTDFLIAASTFIIFDIRTGLYSILGLFAKAFLVDSVIESFNICKSFTIVTSNPQPIEDFIMNTMKRGVTRQSATGAYTGEEHTVLLTVCSRHDAVILRRKVKELDPSSFVIVTNTNEIIGRGFRAV